MKNKTNKETWELIDPYPGAHIRVKMGCVYHHGIYVSDECIVQFGLPFDGVNVPSNIEVLTSNIKDFCRNELFIEVRTYNKKEKKLKRKDEDIIKYALTCIGESGYNIWSNNCEHFANRCVFNKSSCKQIDDFRLEVEKLLNKN